MEDVSWDGQGGMFKNVATSQSLESYICFLLLNCGFCFRTKPFEQFKYRTVEHNLVTNKLI